MNDKINNFTTHFPSIQFDISQKKVETQLSIETMASGEREINSMLTKAKKEFNQAKKGHRRGRISSEELFDYEWYVEDLKQQLNAFKQTGSNLDI
mgnify:CR=1 FL=1